MRLYDITTETEDFIANGVVSHNCYARPSHAYRNLSPGIDFETRLFAKVNAAEKLREELSKPGYRCQVISLGANTDPYQPIEREWKITRGVLEVLAEFDHPVGIVTKNAMVERDLDHPRADGAEESRQRVHLGATTSTTSSRAGSSRAAPRRRGGSSP